jgi:DNA polymerase-3 subunit gamma/tau
LLKTLEEPPKHVKFIFATTEIKKIPLTILSRCQKFALKSINQGDLLQQLLKVAAKENISIDEEAASCIAQNSQGSLRDALSMLDQAIAMSYEHEKTISYELVREMLGMSDTSNIFNLLEYILRGDIKEALLYFKQLYEEGIDAVSLIAQLFELVHALNKAKIIPTSNARINDLAAKLDLAYLSTIWQILSKGLLELKTTNHILYTTEMIIIRLGYTAMLPSVLALANMSEKEISNHHAPSNITLKETEKNKDNIFIAPEYTSFGQILDLCKVKKELLLHHELMEEVKLINFKSGLIELSLKTNTVKNLIPRFKDFLSAHTDIAWQIVVKDEAKDTPTLRQEEELHVLNLKEEVKTLPLVNLALDKFVGSTIISVKEQ